MERPDSSELVTLSNGEQLRLAYDNVGRYMSAKQGKQTVVTIGWGDGAEDFILDIPFADFDKKLEDYKERLNLYWEYENMKHRHSHC